MRVVKHWHRLPRVVQIAQIAHSGRCLLPESVEGHIRQGSEQPGLFEDVPAHCGGAGLDDL